MRIAYFDCFSGASGDMIVAALIDAGADAAALARELRKLPLQGLAISCRDVTRKGLHAKKFDVQVSREPAQPQRRLEDVLSLIRSSSLSELAKERSETVFRRLAEAEAVVHGVCPSDVHFHEVGALDSIADIVGACIALELLGIEKVYSSPLSVGTGEVETSHGRLPLPAPATAELLKSKPVRGTGIRAELTTPTGAALLTSLAADFCDFPDITIEAIGYGAGEKDLDAQPNVLRVFIGSDSPQAESDWVWEIQTNIDDMSPELCGYLMERLLAAGALDAFITPVLMKKSRPGHLITVLATAEGLAAAESTIFAETTTLGIRKRRVGRSKLSRRELTVQTRYGPVRGKLASLQGRPLFFSPEYESAKEAAARARVPLREVMEETRAEFRKAH